MAGSLLGRAGWVRVLPFVVFMALLALRGAAPDDGSWGFDARWLYAAKVAAVAAVLLLFWREYGELSRQRWPTARELLLAVASGLVVFVLWIHLDAAWMTIGSPAASFAPVGADGRIDWTLVAFRIAGAALVVLLLAMMRRSPCRRGALMNACQCAKRRPRPCTRPDNSVQRGDSPFTTAA